MAHPRASNSFRANKRGTIASWTFPLVPFLKQHRQRFLVGQDWLQPFREGRAKLSCSLPVPRPFGGKRGPQPPLSVSLTLSRPFQLHSQVSNFAGRNVGGVWSWGRSNCLVGNKWEFFVPSTSDCMPVASYILSRLSETDIKIQPSLGAFSRWMK